jgi:ribokinase
VQPVILVSEHGENCIVVSPGANAHVAPEDIYANISTICEAGMVLAQLEIPLETVEYLAAICGRAGVPLMLDPAPAQVLSDNILKSVSWLTPNETETDYYSDALITGIRSSSAEERAQRILARGSKGVVSKMGANGAYIADPDEQSRLSKFGHGFKWRLCSPAA